MRRPGFAPDSLDLGRNGMHINVWVGAVGMMLMAAGNCFAQDTAGEQVFGKCKACHVVDTDKNKIGPSLMGVIGRTAGTHAGFKYSNAMVEAGTSGIVWDEAALTSYLQNPKAFIKGTKMAFAGLKAEEDVANVIAYLKQFSQ